MAEPLTRRFSLHLPWATLLKVIAAVALVWLWSSLVWLVLLILIALIIAAGLSARRHSARAARMGALGGVVERRA